MLPTVLPRSTTVRSRMRSPRAVALPRPGRFLNYCYHQASQQLANESRGGQERRGVRVIIVCCDGADFPTADTGNDDLMNE